MKNILIFLIIFLPMTLLAQTKPMPNNSKDKTTKDKVLNEKKPAPYAYMVMNVTENISKKNNPRFSFKFRSFSVKHTNRLNKSIEGKGSVIEVINLLGQRGWELVAVDNGSYFFKHKSIDRIK